MSDILNKIKKLRAMDRKYLGLIDAKVVTIKQDRQCSKCKKTITKGDKALTASKLIDKKFNMEFSEAYNLNKANRYSYLPVRHWMCLACANKISRVSIKKSDNFDIDKINLDDYDEDTQLEILKHAYSKGQLELSEYEDMTNALIDAIAFRDTLGIGQE